MQTPQIFKELNMSSLNIINQFTQNYTVLFDPSVEEVIRLAEIMPKTYIFIFINSAIETGVDYGMLPRSDYIVRPISLSAVRAQERLIAAQKVIEFSLCRDYTLQEFKHLTTAELEKCAVDIPIKINP